MKRTDKQQHEAQSPTPTFVTNFTLLNDIETSPSSPQPTLPRLGHTAGVWHPGLQNGHPDNGAVPQTKDQEGREEVTWSAEWGDFADGIAISGMRFIVNSQLPLFRRLLWTVLVLVGGAWMAYQLVERFNYFYSYPKSTLLEVEYPTEIKFPAITICNENRVHAETARDMGLYDMFNTIYWPYRAYFHPGPPLDWEGLDKFHAKYGNDVDWREATRHWTPKFSDIVLACEFSNGACGDGQFTFTEMGLCVTLNKGGEWKTFQPGSGRGLKMSLFVDQANYVAPRERSMAGFRILAHEPGEFPDIVNKGSVLAPGSINFIALTKVKKFLLHAPYGDCRDDVRLEYSPYYTVDGCYIECLANYLYRSCGCMTSAFAEIGNHTVCSPRADIECAFEYGVNFYVKKLSKDLCFCPPACNTTEYTIASSETRFSNRYKEYLAEAVLYNTVKTEYFDDNYIEVVMYYPTLSVTKITEEKAYDIFTLFCDMGGALGLLLGSTFLTLYEFVDFFIFTAWQVYRRRHK